MNICFSYTFLRFSSLFLYFSYTFLFFSSPFLRFSYTFLILFFALKSREKEEKRRRKGEEKEKKRKRKAKKSRRKAGEKKTAAPPRASERRRPRSRSPPPINSRYCLFSFKSGWVQARFAFHPLQGKAVDPGPRTQDPGQSSFILAYRVFLV